MAEEEDVENGGLKSFDDLDDDEECPLTGLNGAQKKQIWESWCKMVGETNEDFRNLGVNLVLWLFEVVPHMRAVFSKFSPSKTDDELRVDDNFVRHAQNVIVELDTIIKLLPDPDLFKARVEAMVNSHLHKKPRIGIKYFKPLHNNIRSFVAMHLKESTESSTVSLWHAMIGVLCNVVEHMENQMPEEPAQAAGGDVEDAAEAKAKKKGCCCVIA